MFKRLVLLVTFWAALLSAFSCTKTPAIEYDLDGVEGKWLVTSTTGEFIISHENVFTTEDTVRFYNGVGSIVISRPGQNRYYDEIKNVHYYYKLSGLVNEDRLSFLVPAADKAHTFELVESGKDRLVFQYKGNGAKAVLKKEE